MPLFQTPSPQRSPLFSPLKSNIEDMIRATQQLEEQLAFFVDDSETFGLLTEETFLENGPVRLQVLLREAKLTFEKGGPQATGPRLGPYGQQYARPDPRR
jgi:hypothetical protein